MIELKELNNKLIEKEKKYLENFKGASELEKQRDEIKKDYEHLRELAKGLGINVNKYNWRDSIWNII